MTRWMKWRTTVKVVDVNDSLTTVILISTVEALTAAVTMQPLRDARTRQHTSELVWCTASVGRSIVLHSCNVWQQITPSLSYAIRYSYAPCHYLLTTLYQHEKYCQSSALWYFTIFFQTSLFLNNFCFDIIVYFSKFQTKRYCNFQLLEVSDAKRCISIVAISTHVSRILDKLH